MTIYKYAVIGNPVSHSKSPQIHTAFAQQEGVQIEYQRILADETNFLETVNKFRAAGGLGLNVTLPFKVTAFQQCKTLNEYARAAHSVNTISFDAQGNWLGANTDGLGLLQDLASNIGLALANKKILIMGAGGSTRGILLPILQQHPARLVIVNRDTEKALHLTEIFSAYENIHACAYSDLGNETFDLVINATSASLSGSLPPVPDTIVDPDSACYDLYYSDNDTSFICWAKNLGVKTCSDGLGMLVEQAAESYYLWRSFRPDTRGVYNLLKQVC